MSSPTTDHAEHAPRPAPKHARRHAARAAEPKEPGLYTRYIGAMLYFMGAALIAGAVVHYPIDPPQYTVICIVGAFVFLLGTVFNELILAHERPSLARALSLVTFSLLLSFGVGLVGGGIQHFTQFPERSALMTPIGLVMSFAAFIAKDQDGRWRHAFGLFGAGVVATALVTYLGMSALGNAIGTSGHDHGSDHHGTEAPAGADPSVAPTGVPADQPSTAPSGEPSDAGDTAHDHSTHPH